MTRKTKLVTFLKPIVIVVISKSRNGNSPTIRTTKKKKNEKNLRSVTNDSNNGSIYLKCNCQ